jgi:O-acetyl-ADP-ribose deacetylase (regulator of RNase III)
MVSVIKGDITRVAADAIVNAANSSLLGGGGVDGAIQRAAGPALLNACMKIRSTTGECQPGDAVITIAGNLPAKFVIHTVGPIWHGGQNNESTLLRNAYINSMRLAIENGCHSIAFPNISTGVYGYPKEQAAHIALKTVFNFLKENDSNINVIFCCFDEENFRIMNELLNTVK